MLTFGAGLLDKAINNLPFEAHIPTYNFCGPGTRLKRRLALNQSGINSLDNACKSHDISYSKHKDLEERHKADKVLEEKAWERVKAKDASFGEKSAAWLVTKAMKIKRKLGMGAGTVGRNRKKNKKAKQTFNGAIIKRGKKVLGRMKHPKSETEIKEGINFALSACKKAVKDAGGKQKIQVPRIIPIPKRGGILPLLPIFAGLSALGSLAGGASAIAKAVKDTQNANKTLQETKRHNKEMETQNLNKKGNGLYLKPYKTGMGLYLSSEKQKNY